MQVYFYIGNLNPKDWYIAKKMHKSLKELTHKNEISVKNKNIKYWSKIRLKKVV